MRFESKRDGWLVVVSLLIPIFVLAVIGGQWYLSHRDVRGPLAAAVIVLIAVLLLGAWTFRSTYYVIDGAILLIRSSGITWRIPIRDITAITPTRSAVSSPALSLDRLRIDYGRKFILVSPEDKEAFIDALLHANPDIMRR